MTMNQPPPVTVVADIEPPFEPLDPRALPCSRVSEAIGWSVLLILGLAGVGAAALFFEWLLIWAIAAWVVLGFLAVWVVVCFQPRSIRAWGYRIDERVLLVKNGVWFRTVQLVPLSRMQHVDIKRGPIQRRYGLSSLTIHTAGTHDATITIPGLDENQAVRLRDHLVALGIGGAGRGDDAV
jgi:uncharacterized protein